MTWHNSPEPHPIEEEEVVEIADNHHLDNNNKHDKCENNNKRESILPFRIGVSVVLIASALFLYFTFSFITHRIYEEARVSALRSSEKNDSDSSDNFFQCVEQYESLVRGLK